jgi:hypothetical protein
MDVSIAKMVYKKFKYNYKEEIQNIFNIIYNDGRKSFGSLEQTSGKLSFKIHKGGKKQLIKLKDRNIYEYHIDAITPLDDTQKQIHFMNLTENHDNCVFLYFDTKDSGNNSLIIQSIMNDKDCVKSDNDQHIYKVGDILMQIIIQLVKIAKPFSHIKQIELSDVSKKKCYGISLELIYLKTITDGIPFYAKYGFRPQNEVDYEIFRYNRNNYKLNKTITNDQLFTIIKESKLKKETYEIYKKYFNDYIKNNKIINPKELLESMIVYIDNTHNVNEKKEICNLVYAIYKEIYKILGYKEYRDKIWILKIRK